MSRLKEVEPTPLSANTISYRKFLVRKRIKSIVFSISVILIIGATVFAVHKILTEYF